MRARVYITLKTGVLDPAGQAVEKSLHALGYGQVSEVRLGKFVELNVAAAEPAVVQKQVEAMCEKLLANTVVENYRVELLK
ncbi:MAG: phosphoribosylformylglycinamidine synthase subunit PurS [Myxococcaceae bacterium]|nr:phosphoribosylformylglycinamidine synthase subunit PurS [Myxococcaceae bacterium]